MLRLTPACAGFHFSYLLHLLAAEPGGWAAHAAHVAANVSNLPAGRALLVAPTDGRVALLARALAAPGAAAAARWGSATALRNCALDEELHGALLAPVGDSASPVVPALLAPLAPAARVAEQAVPLREACADALAALARTEAGRAAMWAAGAVEAMRVAYEDEQAPRVCAALEQAVRDAMLDATARLLTRRKRRRSCSSRAARRRRNRRRAPSKKRLLLMRGAVPQAGQREGKTKAAVQVAH